MEIFILTAAFMCGAMLTAPLLPANWERFLVEGEGPTIIFPHQPIRLIAWQTLRAGRLITFQSNPVLCRDIHANFHGSTVCMDFGSYFTLTKFIDFDIREEEFARSPLIRNYNAFDGRKQFLYHMKFHFVSGF